MTIEKFNKLSEQQKVELIFDSNKITERVDNETNFQLFQISNFYIEAKTSLEGKFKRNFTTYTLKELPPAYIGEVLSIPIVVLDNNAETDETKKAGVKQKKAYTAQPGKI